MKLLNIIFVAAFFAIPALASEVELSRSGDFVIITDQYKKIDVIRWDRITSVQIRSFEESSDVAITTEELVVRHASGQHLEGGASAYKKYKFRFTSKKLAVDFVDRLITAENRPNQSRE